MATVTRDAQTTNPAPDFDPEVSPAGWPSWAGDRIELGPDPSDRDSHWWAANAPSNADCYDVEDLDERAALEASALASIEMGLIPADCGFEPNTADGVLHEGSDPTWCPCLSCVLERTRHFASE